MMIEEKPIPNPCLRQAGALELLVITISPPFKSCP